MTPSTPSSTLVSGLALSIRGATESITIDLANITSQSLSTHITSSLSSPLPLSDMIRITFVVGAGKLARKRYDESTSRTLVRTLQELGYVEDRGASCVSDCGGSFKSQHDTGKNVRTVVVFPKIVGEVQEELEEKEVTKMSPIDVVAMSSMPAFIRGIEIMCPSWSQKKCCLSVINDLQKSIHTLDDKLVNGKQFNDTEQELYDSVSCLEEKETHLKSKMQTLVESGQLTTYDKKNLLDQIQERIHGLEVEIQKLQQSNDTESRTYKQHLFQLEKVEKRETKIHTIQTITPHPLQYQQNIQSLQQTLQPLLQLEERCSGRLLTLKETTFLARKDELLEEITEWEDKSRGWFEEDEQFQARLKSNGRKTLSKKHEKGTKKKMVGSSGLGEKLKPANNWVKPPHNIKKVMMKNSSKKPVMVNSFAAMMMDSDSD